MSDLIHFEIWADDPQRARKFYEDLFDWKIYYPPHMDSYQWVETVDLAGQPGIGGGIAKRSGQDVAMIMYFNTLDIDAATEQVRELGGEIVRPRAVIPGIGYDALCRDPEGNLFGIGQMDSTAGEDEER